MQETSRQPSLADTVLSSALIWRLAQVVLVLAAAFFYVQLASFGGMLQQERLFQNPHTGYLVRAAALGVLVGLCLGLSTKDFSSGRVAFALDWPTLLINLAVTGIFIAVSVSLNVSAIRNTEFVRGPIKDAVVLSPLLPFVWAGLALSTIVTSKPAPPPPAPLRQPPAPPSPAEDDPGVMAP